MQTAKKDDTTIIITTIIFILVVVFIIRYLMRHNFFSTTKWNELPYINKVTENQQAFGEKVISISNDLGIKPEWLMIVMNNESGENSHIKNMAGGSATGLIQFTAKTAASMGTTTADLAAMSNLDQLDYVKRYLQPYASRVNNAADLYLVVFYPDALYHDDSYVFPGDVVANNGIFFKTGNTKADFDNYVKNKYPQYYA